MSNSSIESMLPLWQSYFDIQFQFDAPLQGTAFAILTAWNPKSQPLSLAENQQRNLALVEQLTAQQLGFQRMNGGATDGSWFEPGFALFCSRQQAHKIAAHWQQNAIYWVENGRLYLDPVLMASFSITELGEFADFIAS
ncbi:hypothetical protein VST7929_00495 [Vibrio stylophorae]|uniref:DUF3293 domain-containing protein n=1 Tax=Vibrio stylophorae TaxID=659351 RepID=A0ABM8ZRY2_9VIBR|nr:DUF3293 domain-containing protein [Vibrio stylophorae]CAH0532655.1 hypothetical protein VST7929_00495 [Vibrio stylophorae]